jgi:L-ribulose-5-phosphate 3-epimerase
LAFGSKCYLGGKVVKIGINASVFPSNMTVSQGFKIAKRAGFDSVELNVSDDGYIPLGADEYDVLKYRKAAENMSLELCTLSVSLLWNYPLTSNDPAVVSKGKDIVRKAIRIARWLGADTLLTVPGIVTEDVPYDIAYKRAVDAARELAEDAQRENVCIGLENAWNKFLLSPLEFKQFIDEIGSDWVKVYFDAGNAMVTGYPQHWISILKSRISKIHVKDFLGEVGNVHGFTNLMNGDLDWYGLRDALRNVGFNSVITAQIPSYRAVPELGIRHAGEVMKRIFKAGDR